MAYLTDLSFGPDTRIVLVGTTQHPLDRELLPPIPHAKNNIDQLDRLFTHPDICGLDKDCIVRLLDCENASEIADEIARAAREATDTLLVYYVGHGLYGDADTPLYLAAQKTTEGRKAFNGVPVSLVKKAIRSSPARKRILILDCCYSGRAMSDGALAPGSAQDAAERSIDIEGTYGIAAVPENKKALAPPGEEFTRFTGALLEVLERGLPTDNRVLTLEDVFAEVERKIDRKADAPLPMRIVSHRGEKFRIARNQSQHGREMAGGIEPHDGTDKENKGSIGGEDEATNEPRDFFMVLAGGVFVLLLLLLLWRWQQLSTWWAVFPVIGWCWMSWLVDIAAERKFKEMFSKALRLVQPSDTDVAKDADVAKLTLAVFEFVYALPRWPIGRKRKLSSADWTLFNAWWALVSSAVIAFFVTLYTTYHWSPANGDDTISWSSIVDTISWSGIVGKTFWLGTAVNIFSDYLAVLVIRKWLDTDQANPQRALLFAVSAGILLVISFTGLRLTCFMAVIQFSNACSDVFPIRPDDYCKLGGHLPAPGAAVKYIYLGAWPRTAVQNMWPRLLELHLPGVVAASIVHVWLPVFALFAYGVRLLNLGRRLNFTFINKHPVLASGIIAGVVAEAALAMLFAGIPWLIGELHALLPWLMTPMSG